VSTLQPNGGQPDRPNPAGAAKTCSPLPVLAFLVIALPIVAGVIFILSWPWQGEYVVAPGAAAPEFAWHVSIPLPELATVPLTGAEKAAAALSHPSYRMEFSSSKFLKSVSGWVEIVCLAGFVISLAALSQKQAAKKRQAA
jgi:hypothetical protein